MQSDKKITIICFKRVTEKLKVIGVDHSSDESNISRKNGVEDETDTIIDKKRIRVTILQTKEDENDTITDKNEIITQLKKKMK